MTATPTARLSQATSLGPKLTAARTAALHVLAARHPRPCRYSNETSRSRGHIYWQSANWLINAGYVRQGPEQALHLTDAGVTRATAEGLYFDPEAQPVNHEAQVSADLKAAAADLYRALNESLSEHLAGMEFYQLAEVFAYAQGAMYEDRAAGKPLDLLRAFTDAVLTVDPAYDQPDPAQGGPNLTPAEQDLARRVLAESKEVHPADCVCVFSCADDPATACSLSGEFHVHPDDGRGIFGPCPEHPGAPGDL